MGQLLQTYLPLVIFIGIAFVISAAILVAPFVIAVNKPDPEKVSAYECGFDAFDDARMKFDVRFYLVSLLFIIFDLEVAFLELLQGLEQEFRQFIQVDGRFFSIFMTSRRASRSSLPPWPGPGLIAPDLANNALPLYFSRPLTRWSYGLARLTVLVGMLSFVTWIPGLLLFGCRWDWPAAGGSGRTGRSVQAWSSGFSCGCWSSAWWRWPVPLT